MSRFFALTSFVVFVAFGIRAGEEPSALDDVHRKFAASCEAAIVARVGAVAPKAAGGVVALWVGRSLSGNLRGGKDIIWIASDDLPGAEVSDTLWLLFLKRGEQGNWHTLHGANGEGPTKVPNLQAPLALATAAFFGNHGEPPPPDLPDDKEVKRWIEDAANGGRNDARVADAKLLAAGDAIRPFLKKAAETDSERSIAAAARMLLPLTGGGPAVNGLRLMLRPEVLELHDGDTQRLTVNFGNITATEIVAVTGQSANGEVVRSIAAFEVWPLQAKDAPKLAPLKTVIPESTEHASAPNPFVHSLQPFTVFPVDVEVTLERLKGADKDRFRLKFPFGYVDLPGLGKYEFRVRFDCPGPRPDQERLVEQNFWGGGQLVSNSIVIKIGEGPPAAEEK